VKTRKPEEKIEVECPVCHQVRGVRKGRIQMQKAWGTWTGRCTKCARQRLSHFIYGGKEHD
jgi:hypothetical protein